MQPKSRRHLRLADRPGDAGMTIAGDDHGLVYERLHGLKELTREGVDTLRYLFGRASAARGTPEYAAARKELFDHLFDLECVIREHCPPPEAVTGPFPWLEAQRRVPRPRSS
jgi:hypothetical protein